MVQTLFALRALGRSLLLCFALAVLVLPARAEKPDRPDKAADHQVRSVPGVLVQVQIGDVFGERQRSAVRRCYGPRLRAGKCPPGLAKKNHACQPPGQARQWQLGQPLPAFVVSYPVPRAVSLRLGLPPPGHAYVRVAADILLIAIGTRLVIDAIEDLGGL